MNLDHRHIHNNQIYDNNGFMNASDGGEQWLIQVATLVKHSGPCFVFVAFLQLFSFRVVFWALFSTRWLGLCAVCGCGYVVPGLQPKTCVQYVASFIWYVSTLIQSTSRSYSMCSMYGMLHMYICTYVHMYNQIFNNICQIFVNIYIL